MPPVFCAPTEGDPLEFCHVGYHSKTLTWWWVNHIVEKASDMAHKCDRQLPLRYKSFARWTYINQFLPFSSSIVLHRLFMGQMLFLSSNRQRQTTDVNSKHRPQTGKITRCSHSLCPEVLLPSRWLSDDSIPVWQTDWWDYDSICRAGIQYTTTRCNKNNLKYL